MKFNFSEEHLMIQKSARDFAQQELLPGVIERDELQKFPKDEINKMGQMGFLGMMTSPKYGGGGMDTVSYILAMEEISKIDASSSVIMSVNNSLVCWGIEKYGTEEQKQKYLPKLTSGEHIGAFCYQNLKLALMPHHKEQQQLKKKTIMFLMELKIGSQMVILLLFT